MDAEEVFSGLFWLLLGISLAPAAYLAICELLAWKKRG